MLSSRNYKSPFTPSQWIELENQGLIFKYMVSGLPIPPQLISSLKTSLLDYSPSNSIMPPTPPTYGLQMGFDRRRRRRSADPDEPAERCRRTDGKKWRCSKEAAYPDSKYCERHMHRGRNRNRSRKPVELISTSNSDSLSSITTPTSSNYSLSSTSPITITTPTPTLSSSSSLFSSEAILPQHHHHPFLYPPFSTPLNYNINAHHHLLFDSASYSYHPDQYYRYGHGMRPFSPEVSENVPSQLPNSYLPLTMSSSKGYSDLTFECLTENSKHDQKKQQQEEEKDQQHCYVLGTDFKSPPRPIKVERGERNQKPFHHFLGESKDSFWLNIEENQSNHTSFSTTQLSIFKSLSTKELFASKSKFITDG